MRITCDFHAMSGSFRRKKGKNLIHTGFRRDINPIDWSLHLGFLQSDAYHHLAKRTITGY